MFGSVLLFSLLGLFKNVAVSKNKITWTVHLGVGSWVFLSPRKTTAKATAQGVGFYSAYLVSLSLFVDSTVKIPKSRGDVCT